MTKKQRTILLAILGVVGVFVIAVVGTGIWIVRSHVENVSMDEATATRSFDDIRTRFGNTAPVIALRGDGPVLLRRPAETQPSATVKTLHVLRWDGRAARMSRIDVPFSLLRLRDGVFRLRAEPDATGLPFSTSVRVADIERYGSTLLVDDDMPNGDRVLIWSD
jgi:hypothetical protein